MKETWPDLTASLKSSGGKEEERREEGEKENQRMKEMTKKSEKRTLFTFAAPSLLEQQPQGLFVQVLKAAYNIFSVCIYTHTRTLSYSSLFSLALALKKEYHQ